MNRQHGQARHGAQKPKELHAAEKGSSLEAEKLWEERLLVYLQLGPERTVEKAWRAWAGLDESTPTAQMPREWRNRARLRQWRIHAQAYDRGGSLLSVYDVSASGLTNAERGKRLVRASQILLQQTLLAIGNAKLDTLAQEEALKHLPSTRDLLIKFATMANIDASKQESGAAGEPSDQPLTSELFSTAVWNAALEAAMKKLLGTAPVSDLMASMEHTPVSEAGTSAKTTEGGTPPPPALLVIVGNDPNLKVDLAMLRAVKRETGLHFGRIENVTSRKLLNYLRREHELGRPVRWLHLACHGSEEGVQLCDGVVDGDWLSTHLQGIEVLLLAACNGDAVGDWLPVIPFVITFSDAIDNGDAASFTRHFWTELARSGSPDSALAHAAAKAPPHVDEFVVKHW